MFKALCSWRTAPKIQRACLSMIAWSLGNEQQAKVRDYYLALDSDFNGAITVDEFKTHVEHAWGGDAGAVHEVFEALDSNHDGQITYSDFLAAMIAVNID